MELTKLAAATRSCILMVILVISMTGAKGAQGNAGQ